MELVYSSLRAVDNVIVGWSHDGVPICLRSRRLGDRGIYNWSMSTHVHSVSLSNSQHAVFM